MYWQITPRREKTISTCKASIGCRVYLLKASFLSREKNRRLPYFVNICLDKIRSRDTRGYYAPSVQTTKHLDITHQATLGYYTPSSQIPTHWRYYSRHGVLKLLFRKERGRSFRGSILQMLIVVLLP